MTSGLGLVSSLIHTEKATFRVGNIFEEVIQDGSIKLFLLFAFWEKQDDEAVHSFATQSPSLIDLHCLVKAPVSCKIYTK